MFINKTRDRNPIVIVGSAQSSGGVKTKDMKGSFWRVWPINAKEVFAIQMLEHQMEKFAPYNGTGIILTEEACDKFNNPPK